MTQTILVLTCMFDNDYMRDGWLKNKTSIYDGRDNE